MFHHEFRKTLRGNNSNVFAVKTCSHESIVCPVVNLATYVKLADLMNISLREGSLFRASDSKGHVSSKPFVGSAVANLIRLHLMITTLNTDEGETMHGFRSGCSITLSLLGASDDQVAGKTYRQLNINLKSRKLWTCCFLPLFFLAQGSVEGKKDTSPAQPLEAEFRVRNGLEVLSFAFP